jgi:hypothetical protein
MAIRGFLAALGACSVLAAVPAADGAAATRLGLTDDAAFGAGGKTRRVALNRARAAGAGIIRFSLDWSRVGPRGRSRPRGFDATDPAARGYRWNRVDAVVREAHRRGLDVMLTVVGAPAWAEGEDRPASAAPGSWLPDPEELGDFVRAAGRRYSGFFDDPASGGDGLTKRGRALPRVRLWQIWDEPNNRRVLRAPDPVDHYRSMLNAAADVLREVDGGNLVVTGGTRATAALEPYPFWRRLLCLTPALERDESCAAPARFHIQAHNLPVPGLGPGRRASGGAVNVPEVGRLRDLARRAREVGAITGGPKPLWITSLGWSGRRQARNLVDALERLVDGAGAAAVIWDRLRDAEGDRTGLYARGSRPGIGRDAAKRSLSAFRVPLAVRPAGRGSTAWGIGPSAPGRARRLTIERRAGGRWKPVASTRTRPGVAYRLRLRTGRGVYRAVSGRLVGAAWYR